MPDSILIGGVETFFANMICNPRGAQRIIRRIDVPGMNGVALRKEEKIPGEFPGRSEVYVSTTAYSAENAALLRQLYDEIVGEIVTLSLQSVDYNDICVIDVEVQPHIPLVAGYFVVTPTGAIITEDAYLVTANWRFIFAGVVA